MKFRTFILNIGLIISTGSLGVGYFLAGYWQIVPVLFGILFLGIIVMKTQPVVSLSSSFLLAYIILAVIGVVADLSVELMIIACTFALVSWDLMLFEHSLVGDSALQTNTSLEKHHLRSLSIAIAAGLLLAFVSLYVRLALPFGVIVSLVLIVTGFLTYSVQHISNTR